MNKRTAVNAARKPMIVKTDFERRLNWRDWQGRRRWGGGFFGKTRVIVLRLAAFMAESGVGRQLRTASAKIGHDSSLT
jgi:hypothetical protein